MNDFRQGEVISIVLQPGKFLVVSADDYNLSSPVAQPVVVPIIRSRDMGSAYAVETNEADPVKGSILVPYPEPLFRNTPAEREGLITGSTMAKVQEALRLFYSL